MDIAVLLIGDELLIGQVTDTNSGAIARMITPYGWHVARTMTVPDNAESIAAGVRYLMAEYRVVVTTGGLGPTKDDITKQVMLDIFGGTLRQDDKALANVKRIFNERGLELNKLTEQQAMIPDSCTPIPNDKGTAPGMWFNAADGHVLAAMPGVPFETEHMFGKYVLPMLMQRFTPGAVISHNTLLINGISESALAERLTDFESGLPSSMHLAYLPDHGYLRLRLDTVNADSSETETVLNHLCLLAGKNLIARTELTIPELLLQRLQEHSLTIATAESCTGGSIASAITSVPGSSQSMLGGVVAYSNSVKHNVLRVSDKTLATFGAVSEPVVTEMASGVAALTGADVSVATSGIAGPGGGTKDKPVGTVCIAVNICGRCVARTFRFGGNRSRVVNQSVNSALIMLIRELGSV